MKRFVSSHRIEVSGTCSSSSASEFKSKKFRSCLIDSQIFRAKIVHRTEQHPSIHRHSCSNRYISFAKAQNVPDRSALPLCITTSCPPQDVQPVLLLMLLMHNISVQILKLPCIMINDQKRDGQQTQEMRYRREDRKFYFLSRAYYRKAYCSAVVATGCPGEEYGSGG